MDNSGNLAPTGATTKDSDSAIFHDLSTWSYNCKGITQSFYYIEQNIVNNLVSFLSETWVKPGQNDIIDELFKPIIGQDGQTFSKGGMDNAPSDYIGRPYGGVAFICNHSELFSFQEIPCDSSRSIALKVLDKSNRQIATLIGAYMPYYDKNDCSKTDEFIETLDAIQPIIDEYSLFGPIEFIGDINVQLPSKKQLRRDWFKRSGFNKHSKIMYDFLCSNDLICNDLGYTQDVSYTHFQFANGVYSWIDHVFTTEHPNLIVDHCLIQDHHEDNVSDHLPIRTLLKLKVETDVLLPGSGGDGSRRFPRPNWDNYSVRENFNELVKSDVDEFISDFNFDNISPGSVEALERLNFHIDSFNTCLHAAAAKVSHNKSHKQYKPRHFWCPTLNDLRDRKRFWWRLWCSIGRPREGHVFEVWKQCKKAFRHYFRAKASYSYNIRFSKINSMFLSNKPFWNLLRLKSKRKSILNNDLTGFSDHFKDIMNDKGNLDEDQGQISDFVNRQYDSMKDELMPYSISSDAISKLLSKLKKRSAPGLDGITAEHLTYSSSESVCTFLSKVYSVIISHNIVPNVLKVGVIIPILKKPSLDVSKFKNYRPITLCSIYAKLLELIMLPDCDISESQYGYQKGKGADFCSAMINDLLKIFNSSGSPVYMCSLDAEKCFDSIWHDGLLYKLFPKMTNILWRLLFNWYGSLHALVRINGSDSDIFRVTRGTRQGSVLSPYIFNIFIDDLLRELDQSPCGLRIGNSKFSSLAYADDINTFASNTRDLQHLVDICYDYSRKWRFNFGIDKSKFFISGYKLVELNPSILLGDVKLPVSESIEVLGKIHTRCGSSLDHISERMSKCRQAIFSNGFKNEELCPAVKSHLWKTIGLPSLLYSVCTGPVSRGEMQLLESFQGRIVKSSLYLNKFSRHGYILSSLGIDNISHIIDNQRVNLLRRVFAARPSSYSKLCAEVINSYYTSGVIPKDTLVGHVIQLGLSPIQVAFSNSKIKLDRTQRISDGLSDSISFILKEHIRPGDENHILLQGLTRSF